MLYENVFIFSGQLSQKSAQDKFQESLEEIKKAGGEIIKKESWGLRDLAYKIKKNSKEYDKIIQLEKSKLNIQRFKGLGEMNPEELWNTTLNPETRNLLQVQYSKNLQKDQNLIQTLMGNDVASRKDFIVDNAINVVNLDI